MTTLADPDFRRHILSDGIAARFSPTFRPHEASREFSACSLRELYAALVGRTIHADGGRWLAQAAPGQPGSDFGNLLSTAGEKIAEAARVASAPALRTVAAKRSLRNFKQASFVAGGDFPALLPEGEGTEITVGATSDRSERATLATFSRRLILTRTAILNDDLGVFGQMATMIGNAAAALEADRLALAVTSNPVMSDSNAVFSSAHSNDAASGAALSTTSLGAARAAVRAQKSVGGQIINAPVAYVVVPAGLETAAEQVVAEIALGSDSKPAVVAEPRLDVSSGTAWYAVASPAVAASLCYAYLDGAEGVQVRTVRQRTLDGAVFDARLDFVGFWADPRGWYRNLGA